MSLENMERDVITFAKKSDWGTKPMPDKHTKFKLERSFTEEQMNNLMKGNIPKQMEDKWFWYYEDGKLYAHRSWTGICIYIIEFNNDTGVHTVIANRNSEEYGITGIDEDLEHLNTLLNWWTQPQYDFYNEWLSETLITIKKQANNETDNEERRICLIK